MKNPPTPEELVIILQDHNLWQTTGGRVGKQAIFCNVDLHGMDFTNRNLRKAFFRKANLSHAGLHEAKLQAANLFEANLKMAVLYRANLNEANLNEANLEGANLYNTNLEKAYLVGANFREAKLGRADLGEAYLWRANLQGADLREARLVGADLKGANLEGANLEGANLERANLEETRINKYTRFPEGFDWKRAGCKMVETSNETKTNSVKNSDKKSPEKEEEKKMNTNTKAQLKEILKNHETWLETRGMGGAPADLEKVDLKGVNLEEATLCRAFFGGSNLEETKLRFANLNMASFLSANLRGADLQETNSAQVLFAKANLEKASLENADLFGANFDHANLKGANFQGTNLVGASFQGALIDKNTRFPEGFQWKRAGCVMTETSESNKEPEKGFKPEESSASVGTQRKERDMGTTTTVTKKALSTLAGDCRAAGKRIAVKRGTELARERLCALMAPEGCNSERRAAVSEFLGTPEGEALLQFVVALSWEGIKTAVPEQYQGTGDEIAEELRISALTTVGGTILAGIETVLVPFLAQQTKTLAGEGLSALSAAFQAPKVRVKAPPEAEGTGELQEEVAKLEQVRKMVK